MFQPPIYMKSAVALKDRVGRRKYKGAIAVTPQLLPHKVDENNSVKLESFAGVLSNSSTISLIGFMCARDNKMCYSDLLQNNGVFIA